MKRWCSILAGCLFCILVFALVWYSQARTPQGEDSVQTLSVLDAELCNALEALHQDDIDDARAHIATARQCGYAVKNRLKTSR